MSKTELAKLRLLRTFVSRGFRLLMNIATVVALGLAIFAIYQQGQASERATRHLQGTVCNIIQPFANTPGAPASPSGATLKKAFQDAQGPQGANCTPDPNDGK